MANWFCKMYDATNGEYIKKFYNYEEYHSFIQSVDLNSLNVYFEYNYSELEKGEQ